MTITIHQPEHLIWLGLIDKISQADIFVILDHVQFEKNYFQNRNKIRTKDGWMWLTVPVKKQPLETKIKDIEISYDTPWEKKYLNALQTNYGKASQFKKYFPEIEKIILKRHKLLVDLNIELILFLLSAFDMHPKKIIRSSEMGCPETHDPSDTVLEICKILKKEGYIDYLAGPSGRDYLKLDEFEQEGLVVTFHEFDHPTYIQRFEPFIPFMSSIDLFFHYGTEAKDKLRIRI